MGSRAWKVGGVGFGSTSDPNDELDFDHPEHLQLVFVILETYSCTSYTSTTSRNSTDTHEVTEA